MCVSKCRHGTTVRTLGIWQKSESMENHTGNVNVVHQFVILTSFLHARQELLNEFKVDGGLDEYEQAN